MQEKEYGAANESYYGIALALRVRPALKSFLFQLGDRRNVELRWVFAI